MSRGISAAGPSTTDSCGDFFSHDIVVFFWEEMYKKQRGLRKEKKKKNQ